MADNLSVLTHAVSVARDKRVRPTSILCLFFSACPSAIFRLIAKAVVNSVQRFFSFWWIPHVGKKGFKRFIPSFANGYAFSSVVFVVRGVWVVASASHCHPRRISWAVSAFCGVVAKRIGSAFVAPTASTFTVADALRCNESFNAASALAKPINLLPFSSGVVKNSPIGKRFSYLVRVIVGFVCISHSPIVHESYQP